MEMMQIFTFANLLYPHHLGEQKIQTIKILLSLKNIKF